MPEKRVLLICPPFPKTFWSMSRTLQLTGRRALTPPLGLLTVAALLPPQWQVRLADLNVRPLTPDDWQWADLVMLSGMFVQKESLLGLAREAKERQKTVVAGGPYPTSFPQEVMEAGVDLVACGEAEMTMAPLVATINGGQSRGVIEADGWADMTLSPVPRYALLNFQDYEAMSLQTTRGCPFKCEFCHVARLYGHKPRYKTPAQVVKELDNLYLQGWRRVVFICDDNFIAHRQAAQDILREMILWLEDRGEPLSFWAQTSLNLGSDLEMIDLMTAANFSDVFIGIESPDRELLAQTGKFQNLGHPIVQSLKNIRANGLTVMGSFIIGFDGEEKGAGRRISDLVAETDIPMVMINILTAVPGTALWDRLQQEGRLLPHLDVGEFHGQVMNFRPHRPESEIRGEWREAIDFLYEPSSFLKRTYRYILGTRPTRRTLAQAKGVILPPVGKRSRPLRTDSLRDGWNFLKLIWRQGVAAEYRGQFWKQLWGVYRHNPSRLLRYINLLFLGENLFEIREQELSERKKS